jgi:hypothetical protein
MGHQVVLTITLIIQLLFIAAVLAKYYYTFISIHLINLLFSLFTLVSICGIITSFVFLKSVNINDSFGIAESVGILLVQILVMEITVQQLLKANVAKVAPTELKSEKLLNKNIIVYRFDQFILLSVYCSVELFHPFKEILRDGVRHLICSKVILELSSSPPLFKSEELEPTLLKKNIYNSWIPNTQERVTLYELYETMIKLNSATVYLQKADLKLVGASFAISSLIGDLNDR